MVSRDTSPADWLEVRKIFEVCSELSAAEQRRVLDKCHDRAVRSAVEKLLRADSRVDHEVVDAGPPVDLVEECLVDSVPGGRIGGYRLLKVLGSGGMGTVYEAEQDSPRRTVALKTLHLGLDSDRARTRFEYESAVLARLRHPCIAQIYEAGTHCDHDVGIALPFFAMEYVEEPHTLADYVRSKDLGIRETLALFVKICDAIQYGHQRGVIHRDLKPANILVGIDGRPKVIDFGLARATGDESTEIGVRSEVGKVVGTLRYMSPEQLDLGSQEIDNRVDVYALGVCLFEVLTGRPAFDLAGKTLTGAAEVIRDVDPHRPSSLRPDLDREIDWIVLRAVEKNRELRYASAAALREDLERYLRHEAVEAGPPSAWYRASKFVRRHRFEFSIAISVILAATAALWFETARRSGLRAADAQSALAAATERIQEFRDLREANQTLEADVDNLTLLMERSHLPRETLDQLHVKQDRVNTYNQRLESLHHAVMELARRAERLDPRLNARTESVRLELYAERWRLADGIRSRAEDDSVRARAKSAADFYRKLLAESDQFDRFVDEVEKTWEVQVTCSRPGAELFLFEYREQSSLFEGGEARVVAIPYGVDWKSLPVRPGSWALRLVRDSGALAEDDLIVELAGHEIEGSVFVVDEAGRISRLVSVDDHAIRDTFSLQRAIAQRDSDGASRFLLSRDGEQREVRGVGPGELGLRVLTPRQLAERGSVAAKIFSRGQLIDLVLPPSLDVRLTAAPLMIVPQCRIENTSTLKLAFGEYLIVGRARGCENARRSLTQMFRQSCSSVSVEFLESGTSPSGYRPIFDTWSRGISPPWWCQEREVTCGEYLEFLNDPTTLAKIDALASDRPAFFPRYPHNERAGGFWPRDASGRFRIADDWAVDWPVVGVSWTDAKAYAAWHTARQRASGDNRFVYELPHEMHHTTASAPTGKYVWGERFLQCWVKSCFSRSVACIEPVMTYPVDESRYGIFDLAGSAFEWVEDWYVKGSSRTYVGGSWAMAEPDAFRVFRHMGGPPTSSWNTNGFRLIARRRAP